MITIYVVLARVTVVVEGSAFTHNSSFSIRFADPKPVEMELRHKCKEVLNNFGGKKNRIKTHMKTFRQKCAIIMFHEGQCEIW